MAIITPQTDVYLLKCPLELNDANQLTFATANAQVAYFQSLPKLHIADEDFTYQRKDGVMRVPALIDDLYGYNYCMYKNEGHGNKWFFAYITGMEYLNDSVTAISLKTDTYQTWMFDLVYKRTFVEREHVNSDTIGEHTVPENLETGEYIQALQPINVLPNKQAFPYGADREIPTNAIGGDLMIVFQTTELVNLLIPLLSVYTGVYNKIFSGLYYFGTNTPECARKIIQDFDAAGKADSIVSIFYAPVSFFDNAYPQTYSTYGKVYVPANTTTLDTLLTSDLSITMPSALGSYTPVNKKLLCYPYSFMRVSNNAGADVEFRYEDFAKNSSGKPIPKFTMKGALGQGCNIKLIPKGYKNMGTNTESLGYGVVGAKFPQLAWRSDYYTNWITQNGINVAIGMASNAAGALLGGAGGMITASAGGMAGMFGALQVAQSGSTLLSQVGDVVGQLHTAQVHPDQAKGDTSCVDLMFGYDPLANRYTYYYLYQMCIRPEYAKICDQYLSTFGYKVNEVKIPNITGRRNWNFVKTVGCYIEANIPQDDLEEIKSMFDKGITFWHNPSTFMDYSQNNDII